MSLGAFARGTGLGISPMSPQHLSAMAPESQLSFGSAAMGSPAVGAMRLQPPAGTGSLQPQPRRSRRNQDAEQAATQKLAGLIEQRTGASSFTTEDLALMLMMFGAGMQSGDPSRGMQLAMGALMNNRARRDDRRLQQVQMEQRQQNADRAHALERDKFGLQRETSDRTHSLQQEQLGLSRAQLEQDQPVEQVLGPDGKPVIVSRADAIGQQPYRKPPDPNALDRQVAALMQTGVPRDIALGIAAGRYDTDRHPVSGQLQVVDIANGQVVYKSGQSPRAAAQPAQSGVQVNVTGQPRTPTTTAPTLQPAEQEPTAEGGQSTQRLAAGAQLVNGGEKTLWLSTEGVAGVGGGLAEIWSRTGAQVPGVQDVIGVDTEAVGNRQFFRGRRRRSDPLAFDQPKVSCRGDGAHPPGDVDQPERPRQRRGPQGQDAGNGSLPAAAGRK